MGVETTETAAPAPEPAESTSVESTELGSSERLEAAYALMDEGDPGETPAAEEQTVPDAPAAEEPATPKPDATGEPPAPDSLEALRSLSEKRRGEAAEREAANAPAAEVAQLRAELEALKAGDTTKAQAIQSLTPEALKADPIKALQSVGLEPREILVAMSRQELGGKPPTPGAPQLTALEQRVQAIEAQKAADAQAAADAMKQQSSVAMQKAEQDFVALTGDAKAYPAVARLPDRVRVSWAHQIVKHAQAAGLRYGDDQIAAMMQKELAGEATPGSDQGLAAAASSGDAETRQGAPKSITNDLATPSAARRFPDTEKGRLEKARHIWRTGAE